MTFDRHYLTRIRSLAGLSQRELSRRSRVSKSHINDIERGLRTPSDDVVAKMAIALGVPLRGFYEHEETVI